MYLAAANTLTFATNSAEKMRLDASGNLGLGVTPSAWTASNSTKAFQISNRASFHSDADSIGVTLNAFFDGAWKYIQTATASNYYQLNGQHVWRQAISGSANAAITWTTPMTLTANGRLLLGSISEDTQLLQVNGTAKITGATTFGSSIIASGLISAATEYRLNNQAFSKVAILDAGGGFAGGYNFNISGTTPQHSVTGGISGYYYGSGGTINFYTGTTQTGGTTATSRFSIDSAGAATFSSTLTTGGNILIGATASSIGSMNFIKTGTSPVASRLTFGTDGTGYSFAIAKNQASTITDLVTISDTGNLAVDSNVLFVDAVNNEVGIGTNAPNSVLQVVGSVSKSISDVKTANYTATATDHTILCSAASGAVTITLPAASGIAGRIYVIKKTNASSGVNSVTVDGNASETIDGSASINLACKSSVMLQCDGSNWHILSLYTDTSCL
jgi:hypothetical protein